MKIGVKYYGHLTIYQAYQANPSYHAFRKKKLDMKDLLDTLDR